VFYARDGVAMTGTQAHNTSLKLDQVMDIPGFAETYLMDGKVPTVGARFRQPRLADTLERLCQNGLDDFYRGSLAKDIAVDLETAGSPLRLDDLQRFHARGVTPLSVEVSGHKVFNMPPPTQGLASLILLGVFDRLGVTRAEGFEFIHALVESTKCAFRVRDRHLTDPDYMQVDPHSFLTADALAAMAKQVRGDRAAPWPQDLSGGDTVWLSAADREGCMVSFIQSLYWEFGAGLVLEGTGITWQNRGTSFSLDPEHHNCLAPLKRPFHTIQPALAHLNDGRVMTYGTMGGEGQPQTQAMVFARHVLFNQELQQAVTAPRWLLGRTWGEESTSLKIENRIDPAVCEQLRDAGHDAVVIGAYEGDVTGHAGSLVRHADGLIEGATDPRSDGAVAAA
jgi:gamma-glutamyltranspeptidase/glutathione hydrolase